MRKGRDYLNPVFTAIYLTLGVLITAVELVGVWRKRRGGKGGGDTISENWWYVQRRHPILGRVVMAGFLGWLAVHLLRG